MLASCSSTFGAKNAGDLNGTLPPEIQYFDELSALCVLYSVQVGCLQVAVVWFDKGLHAHDCLVTCLPYFTEGVADLTKANYVREHPEDVGCN